MFVSLFINDEKQLRAGWKVLLFVLAIILLTLPTIFLFKFLPSLLNQVPVAMLLVLPIASWILVRFVDQATLDKIGLQISVGIKKILLEFGIGIGAGALAMCIIYILLKKYTDATFTFNNSPDLQGMLSFFIVMLSVGIYEELQVRGYVLRVLSDGFRFGKMTQKQGFLASVVFTSVIFGLLHLGNPNTSLISTVNIAVAGFMLAFPIALTGRLYASFGLHFAWNWFQGGFFGMPVSGLEIHHSFFSYQLPSVDVLFSGGKFGPEAGIVGLIGMCVAASPFFYIYVKQNRILRIFEIQFNQPIADTMLDVDSSSSQID